MSLPKYPPQIAHYLWHNIWYEFGLTHYAEHFLSPILVLIFEIAAGNFSVILLVSVATHMVRISIVKKRWLQGLVYWLVGWWPVRGPLHWLTAVVPLICRHWLPAIPLIYGHWGSRCIIRIFQRTPILLPWRSRPFCHSLGSAMLVIRRCPLGAIPLVDQWHSLGDPAVSPAQEYENWYPHCYPYLNLPQVFYVVSWAGISFIAIPSLAVPLGDRWTPDPSKKSHCSGILRSMKFSLFDSEHFLLRRSFIFTILQLCLSWFIRGGIRQNCRVAFGWFLWTVSITSLNLSIHSSADSWWMMLFDPTSTDITLYCSSAALIDSFTCWIFPPLIHFTLTPWPIPRLCRFFPSELVITKCLSPGT